jgi:hypothetical protein
VSFDYSRLKATADRLIARFGKTAQIVTTTTSGPDYDPTVTEATTDATVVELDYSLTNRNETLVQQGDKLFLVEADAAPDMEAKIRLDGVDYAMIDVQPLSPGATVLLYEVQARA